MVAWSREILDRAEEMAAEVARAAVDALLDAGIERERIEILRADSAPDRDMLATPTASTILELVVQINGGWVVTVDVVTGADLDDKSGRLGRVFPRIQISSTFAEWIERDRLICGLGDYPIAPLVPLLGSEP